MNYDSDSGMDFDSESERRELIRQQTVQQAVTSVRDIIERSLFLHTAEERQYMELMVISKLLNSSCLAAVALVMGQELYKNPG